MTSAEAAQRSLARRLLEREAGEGRAAEELAAAAERACQKFYPQLARLIGAEGFHAVLARALRLAQRESPFLAGVEGEPGGEVGARHAVPLLKGLREAVRGRDPAEVSDGVVAVFANLIWLLATFVGESVALRQVSSIWPEVPLRDVEPGSGAVGE